MAVTELALFHLKSNKSLDSPENERIKSKLLSAIKAQAAYASYPVYLFSQVEDPSYLYLLGGWDSVETHMKEWIPSAENQQLLSTLQDGVEVIWLQHIDIEPPSHAIPKLNNKSGWPTIPLAAPVIAIGRHFLGTSKKDEFQNTFNANKHYLEAFTEPRSLGGGWRSDPELAEDGENGYKEEFVLFSGWDTVADHFKFAESDGFIDFSKIRETLDGAEIKHVILCATSSEM